MRLFILYPFSGVRGLHRFLLTRSVVTVLSALSSLLPGSHFAEGDAVESPQGQDAHGQGANGQGALVAEMGAAESTPHKASPSEGPDARVSERRARLSASDARSYSELQRSARGEGRRIELAQLDAPVADFAGDVFP